MADHKQSGAHIRVVNGMSLSHPRRQCNKFILCELKDSDLLYEMLLRRKRGYPQENVVNKPAVLFGCSLGCATFFYKSKSIISTMKKSPIDFSGL